ncbi:MAG TPA: hypothetical protein VK196_12930 [Magnetospirillum sp.]|nr:hypothetical protein [Magnetospirillum sp.]
MFGFLKDKFDKDAQAAIERRARQLAPDKAPKAAQAAQAGRSAAPAADDRQAAIARMQAQVEDFVSPERQALIANAMAVHRAKQKILADLDDESRAKLVAMAITTLLHQEQPSDKTKKK